MKKKNKIKKKYSKTAPKKSSQSGENETEKIIKKRVQDMNIKMQKTKKKPRYEKETEMQRGRGAEGTESESERRCH